MATERPARIEITADSRALSAKLREASTKMASFAATSAKVVGRYGAASAVVLGQTAGRGALALGRGLVNVGARAAPYMGKAVAYGAAGVTAALVASGAQVRDFEEGLTRLQIDADASRSEMDALRESIRKASRDTGVGSKDILDGVSSYVALTGDFKGATRQVVTFSRASQATGTAMADIATTAAALQDALKIRPEDMEAALSALTVMGKKGSVTARDMAGEISELGPLMAQFKGGTGLGGLRDMGAAIQVINKRFNNASESTTAFRNLVNSLKRQSGELKKYRVNVFETGPDGVKRMRSLRDILDQIDKTKLARDPALLIKALGSSEAEAALSQLRTYRSEFESIAEAGGDVGAIGRDLDTYLASPAGRMAKSWNEMKEAIAAAFTPERIEAFASALEKVSAGVNRVVGGVERAAQVLGAGAGVALGYDEEHKANLRANARADARVAQIRATGFAQGRWVTDEQARAQIAKEDAAVTGLRRGDFNWRINDADTGEWLKEQRARLATGQFTNADAINRQLDRIEKAWTQAQNAKALQEAVTRGIQAAGLTSVVQIGQDAVLKAVQTAPGLRRRPGG